MFAQFAVCRNLPELLRSRFLGGGGYLGGEWNKWPGDGGLPLQPTRYTATTDGAWSYYKSTNTNDWIECLWMDKAGTGEQGQGALDFAHLTLMGWPTKRAERHLHRNRRETEINGPIQIERVLHIFNSCIALLQLAWDNRGVVFNFKTAFSIDCL